MSWMTDVCTAHAVRRGTCMDNLLRGSLADADFVSRVHAVYFQHDFHVRAMVNTSAGCIIEGIPCPREQSTTNDSTARIFHLPARRRYIYPTLSYPARFAIQETRTNERVMDMLHEIDGLHRLLPAIYE
jgi:hypothetical protein